jgi:cellulose synthase/poly-beta-1,6-N-acetylglucosamine synthase-like glycosyltransferase
MQTAQVHSSSSRQIELARATQRPIMANCDPTGATPLACRGCNKLSPSRLVADNRVIASRQPVCVKQKHAGKHFAHNRALVEAKGQFFGLLASGDALVPDALEKLARCGIRKANGTFFVQSAHVAAARTEKSSATASPIQSMHTCAN